MSIYLYITVNTILIMVIQCLTILNIKNKKTYIKSFEHIQLITFEEVLQAEKNGYELVSAITHNGYIDYFMRKEIIKESN